MSVPSYQRSSRPARRFTGLSEAAALAIIIASLATGLIISLSQGRIGLSYLVLFIVSALLMTLIVRAEGLFTTVISLPILFGIFTVLTSWGIGRIGASENTPLLTRTSLITSVYPLAELFPWIAGITLIAAILAIARVYLLNRQRKWDNHKAQIRRERTAAANRRNTATASQARSRRNQISVEELLARAQRDRARREAEQAARLETTREQRYDRPY